MTVQYTAFAGDTLQPAWQRLESRNILFPSRMGRGVYFHHGERQVCVYVVPLNWHNMEIWRGTTIPTMTDSKRVTQQRVSSTQNSERAEIGVESIAIIFYKTCCSKQLRSY